MHWRALTLAAAVWTAGLVVVSGQGTPHPSLLRNHPLVAYATTAANDPVAQLDRKLQSGEVQLEFEETRGYLTSVLKALGVPTDSQVLVFSKTSFQAPRINPKNPRALFFNDTVSVGFVRGGEVLEFVAQDPKQGSIFYTLEQTAGGRPRFARNDNCIMCHVSEATQNVPGWFVGSVFPGVDGTTMYGPAYTTDHRSPFELRWGGWYVLGSHRAERHMGNAVASDPTDLAAMVTPATVHATSLEGRFDLKGYFSPHSDMVALLVLEHQAQALNLITRVNWESRIGKDALRPLSAAAEELVDYLLFVDESPLPGPISGPSTFASTFSSNGPRDMKGRSLRDLDLQDRLLKYPCSYIIYSDQFNGLPDVAKEAVYARLWQVLSGAERDSRYARLTPDDREAIVEILRDTKPDLPDYFDRAPSSP